MAYALMLFLISEISAGAEKIAERPINRITISTSYKNAG
jgi:hypothetical protein